jgi:hypothetical protein
MSACLLAALAVTNHQLEQVLHVAPDNVWGRWSTTHPSSFGLSGKLNCVDNTTQICLSASLVGFSYLRWTVDLLIIASSITVSAVGREEQDAAVVFQHAQEHANDGVLLDVILARSNVDVSLVNQEQGLPA